MPTDTVIRPRFRKGSLVAARLAGCNWDIDDVGIVLDVSTPPNGECSALIITQRGVILSMLEQQAAVVFRSLAGQSDSIFVLTYEVLSNWQVEEDFEAGLFDEAHAKATSMLQAQRLVHRMGSTKSIVGT
ncbi:hypothetical protein [Ottowia sp.]|uniref:hypothetical protein n=1 Tax=Ottowia sp. TaxID=1898956 RepID=UPI0025CDBAA3|nr:hypothetical protein [Ottowia sp.]MBK6616078.1 hypothetical protein [Ottowia sp.]